MPTLDPVLAGYTVCMCTRYRKVPIPSDITGICAHRRYRPSYNMVQYGAERVSRFTKRQTQRPFDILCDPPPPGLSIRRHIAHSIHTRRIIIVVYAPRALYGHVPTTVCQTMIFRCDDFTASRVPTLLL